MARSVTIGNGNILVGLDYSGQVCDFYYPYVGHSNHVSGASGSYIHRIGIYVDGALSWLSDDGWVIKNNCDESALVGCLQAVNEELGIELLSIDVVHSKENIFLRRFTINNRQDKKREVKLFLGQQFRIFESRRGDTGFFDPRVRAIIHYKGDVTFLVNASHDYKQFTEYNIGLFGIEGKEGTYHDAFDGTLECNPIEHGSVDSIIGIACHLEPNGSDVVDYWITVASNLTEAHRLNRYVLDESVESLIEATKKYWHAWIKKESRDISNLSSELQTLYLRSLTTIRAHTDNRGGIIAASDTTMLHHGRDTYSYVWPRDGAITAHALDRTGYRNTARRFFNFMANLLEPSGYLMHKYRVDGTLGSSWHTWVQDGVARLPIQEDGTALCIFMLWQHYELAHDLEFIGSKYNSFIEPAAKFMATYVHAGTGLPEASYDLWEEKYGMSTHTACATYGALKAASQFAFLLGKEADARAYQTVAERMKAAIMKYLWDDELGMFIKCAHEDELGDLVYDRVVDISSFFAVWYFNILEIDDPKLTRAAKVVNDRLRVADIDGYIRYEHDSYYHLHDVKSPNPWIIATLWMAQYQIKKATKLKDLDTPLELLKWTLWSASNSGMLSEQINPETSEHLSTSPLVWSHAEFVITFDDYLIKQELLQAK